MRLHKERFQLEDMVTGVTGYHDPTVNWNGFACPRFPRAEAEKVVAQINACGEELFGGSILRGYYDEERDAFVMPYDCSELGAQDAWWDVYEGVYDSDLGITLYPLGAYEWVWTVDMDTLKAGDIAKFRFPDDEDEARERFLLLEDPDGGRVLVECICPLMIRPTKVLRVEDLEVERG
jgi:hypothetical protein